MTKKEETNDFGLKRHIPNQIKREIRKRCGFGCVVCGLGIYEYEHVDPEFKDAKEHTSNCMTLLCHQCHGKKTRGQISTETIKRHMKKPKCLQQGYTNEFFDIGTKQPSIKVGESIFNNTDTLFEIEEKELISFKSPRDEGEPFLLNAEFYNDQNELVLKIENNEWEATTDNWDLEIIGRTLKIRERLGKFVLEIENNPYGIFSIKRINMNYKGYKISNTKKKFIVTTKTGMQMQLEGANSASNLSTAYILSKKSFVFGKGKLGYPAILRIEKMSIGPNNRN